MKRPQSFEEGAGGATRTSDERLSATWRPPVESRADAKRAGLSFSHDGQPGIRRIKSRGGFEFAGPGGRRIRDEPTLRRIRSLVIPPAWVDVWICCSATGHLQATGRDARGRKQYRYHSRWREHRDGNKFEHMLDFAKTLPQIRRRVRRDMARPGMPREKVLATIVKLLEETLIRVGNEEYARENGTYGLTTLQTRHAKVSGSRIEFSFKGKSGKQHVVRLSEPRLARIVKRCQDLPGQELFVYEDDQHETHRVASEDVNDYLRSITCRDFTAKDFRTWAGTVLAAVALGMAGTTAPRLDAAKEHLVAAIASVARRLGNTPAVCRKCYVHPAIVQAYLEAAARGGGIEKFSRGAPAKRGGLRAEEAGVLTLLRFLARKG